MAPDKKSVKASPKKEARFWQNEEFVISGTILGAIFGAVLICYFTPVSEYTVKPITAMLGLKNSKKTSDNTEDGNFWTGIYTLSEVMMSLGKKGEYLDTTIDLEYNGQILTISSSGVVSDEETAGRFLKSKEGQLRDAILMDSSSFNGKDFKHKSGINQLKEKMTRSLNNYFDDQDVVVNIFFQSFVLFSEQMEDVNYTLESQGILPQMVLRPVKFGKSKRAPDFLSILLRS
jgi:flagellar basal body-associated protein FliL